MRRIYLFVFGVLAALVMSAAIGSTVSLASMDYPFGWSAQKQPGTDPYLQFDSQVETCTPGKTDIPDEPVRAFRFWNNNTPRQYRVQLNFAANTQNRRMVGETLETARRESSLNPSDPEFRQCSNGSDVVFKAAKQDVPDNYANWEWLNAPYYDYQSGKVYAHIHNEYHGWEWGQCPPVPPDQDPVQYHISNCWFASLTSVSSSAQNDLLQRPDPSHGNTCGQASPPSINALGACYSHSTFPATGQDLVASIPYQYCSGWGRAGYTQDSNIIKGEGDLSGYYYQLALVQPPTGSCISQPTAQKSGVCLIRTNDLSNPSSWMAWDGTGFNSRPSGAYSTPTGDTCQPLKPGVGGQNPWSLTYNRYLKKYMWLGQNASLNPPGVYYSLSDDLRNWSDSQYLMRAPTIANNQPADCPYDPVAYPTLLDPTDPAATWLDPSDPAPRTGNEGTQPNFDHPGRKPDLYFSHFARGSSCDLVPARLDLARIKIEFKQRIATLSNGLTEDSGNPPQDNPDRGFDATATSYVASPVGCNPPQSSCFKDYDTESTERSFFALALGNGQPQQGYGRIGQLNDGSGGMPLNWQNGDDVWYGAAFYLSSGFKTANTVADLLRWESSGNEFGGVRLQPNDTLQLVASNASVATPIGPMFPVPDEGRWFWLEVHQKLGTAGTSGTLSEVFVDGRLVSTSAAPNRGDSTPIMRVKSGLVDALVLPGNSTNLFVDRASVTGGPLGALIYSTDSQTSANAVGVPKTPLGFKTTTAAGGSVTLSWNGPVTGDPPVDGYRLYRQESDGTWSKVGGDISGTSVSTACGSTYRITADRQFSGTSGESLNTAPLNAPC